jgi:hypothetical protein
MKLFRNIPPDLNMSSEAPMRATVFGLKTKSNDDEFTVRSSPISLHLVETKQRTPFLIKVTKPKRYQ